MNRRFSRKLIALAFILVALAAAGCQQAAPILSDNYLTDRSVIAGEPCEAPCWQGITPGETTWEEAIAILQELDGQMVFNLEQAENDGYPVAGWTSREDWPCCQMAGDSEGDRTVIFIFTQLAPNIKLREALDVFGEPVYVGLFEGAAEERSVEILYPERSLSLNVYAGAPDAPLTEESPIISAMYFSPEMLEEEIVKIKLRGWDGLKSYTQYVEMTPVITPDDAE